jgi:AcrR family transcriptional regulator
MARSVKNKPAEKRRYDSSRRLELARQNRAAVLEAARELFIARGYAATTVADIAARAGVSVETIYKSFGNKPGVAKAVFDVAVVGDDDPVPLFERPEIKAIEAEPDARKKIRMFFGRYPERRSRTGPIELVIRDAAAGDPGAAAVRDALKEELHRGMTMFATELLRGKGVRAGLSIDEVADILFAYVSVELYEVLVVMRGWDLDRYARFMTDAVIAALT